MKILIYSIKMLKYLLKNGEINKNNSAFIICSSYDVDIKLNNSIILNFDDVTNISSNSFNNTFAKTIHKFVNNLHNIENLIICCDEGESRSAAIACSIMRYYEMDEDIIWNNPHYHPNLMVYKILCDEFRLENSEERLRLKKKLSDEALKNAIRNNYK